jgi:hypothetical protein
MQWGDAILLVVAKIGGGGVVPPCGIEIEGTRVVPPPSAEIVGKEGGGGLIPPWHHF